MFNSELPKSFFSPVSPDSMLGILGIAYAEVTDAGIPISQNKFIIASKHNEELKNSLMSLINAERNNGILKNALRNSLKMRRLSDEYACLLQEKIPDDNFNEVLGEYEKISAPYAFEARSVPAKEIAFEAKVVLDAVGGELGSDEIADLLELDVLDVENALTEYSS